MELNFSLESGLFILKIKNTWAWTWCSNRVIPVCDDDWQIG